MAYTYHVAKNGSNKNPGTAELPLLTINAAAKAARPGDTVLVHEGEYREWVQPALGGLSNTRRIVYRAAPGEHVVIKGSERITGWQQIQGTVWATTLPNTIFGDYNPYNTPLVGDWLVYRAGAVHTGDVYLNGKSFYEAESLAEVENATPHTEVLDHWTNEVVPVLDSEQTKYKWYAEVGEDTTTLYANFHGADPNTELTEINVRKCVFYPTCTGINYITVCGFELAQAATPWTPPTADQPGLIGPHWAKGWVIENNVIHDAKTSAISIGKEASTGNNYRTFRKDKPGYQYQLESVFTAKKIGWSKETIGSHIIRNNTIYNCGQNGIVGHLGCVFSEIYGNHIYNIALKREFYGHEIAGIKLHAAIDVHIHHNHIHHCSLGSWMDWQAQGTRISKNLYHNNNRDLFIEVSHGPYMVDHNIFASKFVLDNHAQGGAYVHNLFAGKIVLRKMLNRATPYHAPHSTDVTGYAMVYGGDDRLYSNLFIGGQTPDAVGTTGYQANTPSLAAYIAAVEAVNLQTPGDLEIFEPIEQPVYLNGNAYLNKADACEWEEATLLQSEFEADFSIEEAADGVYLHCTLPEGYGNYQTLPYTTQTLPRVRIVDADFENADGTALILNTDYQDADVTGGMCPGPIAALKTGKNKIKVWG